LPPDCFVRGLKKKVAGRQVCVELDNDDAIDDVLTEDDEIMLTVNSSTPPIVVPVITSPPLGSPPSILANPTDEEAAVPTKNEQAEEASCEIASSSSLESMTVRFLTSTATCGPVKQITVPTTAKLSDLQHAVAEALGITCSLPKPVHRNETEVGDTMEKAIELVTLRVIVCHPREVAVEVPRDCTMTELKRSIATATGSPPPRFLVHHGALLQHCQRLHFSRIEASDGGKVLFSGPGCEKPITAFGPGYMDESHLDM